MIYDIRYLNLKLQAHKKRLSQLQSELKWAHEEFKESHINEPNFFNAYDKIITTIDKIHEIKKVISGIEERINMQSKTLIH